MAAAYSNLEHWWNETHSTWQHSEALWFGMWLFLAHSSTLPVHLLFLLQHFFQFSWINSFKIQVDQEPSPRLISSAVVHSLVLYFVGFPLAVYFFWYNVAVYCTNVHMSGPFPSLPRLALELIGMALVTDFLQYWSHRLLHAHPVLYKYIHAQHHRFVTTVSFASEYANLAELMISNAMPTFAGGFLFGSHLFTLTLWTALRVYISLDAHCGFVFPWSPCSTFLSGIFVGARGHDFHHSHAQSGNFGMLWVWDALCSTNVEYKKYISRSGEQGKARTD